MRRLVAGACAAVLVSSPMMLAKETGSKAVYCTQGAKGDWGLHKFKPLIKVQGGTVFTEMTFDGQVLEEVRLRRFYTDSELAFDYIFDASGQLRALRGSVQVKSVPPPGADPAFAAEMADWLAEADLTPGTDNKIPAHHILYTREKDKIDKPDNADSYVGRFNEAPVYRTIQTVPCAAMLKEAEKMNATQE
ncbi:MAG: hypothetical protein M3O31_13000 [Acidobacteriota bacterium]|nr:hypothetical protein [Acidobacteriota bacterium]